jgi:hypothetical protein
MNYCTFMGRFHPQWTQEGFALKEGKTSLYAAAVSGALVALLSLPVLSMDKPEWRGGIIMGYSLGQNGQPWPEPWRDPLGNNNRGGFYLSQARVQLLLPLDSTFRAVLVGNVIYAEALEAYLEKEWETYRFKVGKFRGAGMKSASGMDEFDLTTVQRPRYARDWNYQNRLHNFRDFGIQGEKSSFGGRLEQRLFFHNANGQNVLNDEPGFPAGPTTQLRLRIGLPGEPVLHRRRPRGGPGAPGVGRVRRQP